MTTGQMSCYRTGQVYLLATLPNAKFFWSITMYNLPERLLVNNPIKRYSIGSNTPALQKAGDGTVTIHI